MTINTNTLRVEGGAELDSGTFGEGKGGNLTVNATDVQVIGVPSEKYGEEVMAWVKAKEGNEITAAELTDFCEGEIAYYKVPKYYKFTNDFPMTVTGKIRKVEMRKISVEELGL